MVLASGILCSRRFGDYPACLSSVALWPMTRLLLVLREFMTSKPVCESVAAIFEPIRMQAQ